jgi:hypothetical protein
MSSLRVDGDGDEYDAPNERAIADAFAIAQWCVCRSGLDLRILSLEEIADGGMDLVVEASGNRSALFTLKNEGAPSVVWSNIRGVVGHALLDVKAPPSELIAFLDGEATPAAPVFDSRDAELARLRVALEFFADDWNSDAKGRHVARAALLGLDPEDGVAVAAAWAARERGGS